MADEKYCRLEQNRVYQVKILNISRERNRSFLKPGTNKRLYVHDIIASDKDCTYKAEYITETETQDEFVQGAVQYFKCSVAGKVGDEVIPFDPEANPHVKAALQELENTPLTGFPQSSSTPLYVHAMSNASMIMAAQLTGCKEISSLDETFRGQLFDLAEDVLNWLKAKEQLGA